MKVVTWNCGGAFRKKCDRLAELNADLYIVQECENPNAVSHPTDAFRRFSENSLWRGSNKNKGIGAFARDCCTLESIELDHNWRGRTLQWFLPFNFVHAAKAVKFLGVWNHPAGAKAFDYIGQFWLFLQNNKEFFPNSVIAGDFNSNAIWDSWDRWWNHTDCVNELAVLGLQSVYHSRFSEEQGKESLSTFLLQKNIEKKYHIDFVFADYSRIRNTSMLKIHDSSAWTDISDHVPIEWEFEDE